MNNFLKISKKVLILQKDLEEQSDIEFNKYAQKKTLEFYDLNMLDNEMEISALSIIIEAIRREKGYVAFPVQIVGALTLLNGNIAEMKTGEGKTITAIIALYLGYLKKHHQILFTQNQYLARRDYEFSRPIFKRLNISSGLVEELDKKSDQKFVFKMRERQSLYDNPIVYTTNDVFGFDYLQSNLVSQSDEKLNLHFDWAIVDEIDSILLDDAQMPLIISGNPKAQSNLFKITNTFVSLLEPLLDYQTDNRKKTVWLTKHGVQKANKFFRVKNLFNKNNFELVKHVMLALQANVIMKMGEDYIVLDGEVKLLDSTTGRIMEGSLFESGLHQAIEAKELVSLSQENRSMASVTYQNLFRMFNQLSGLTGTAYTNRKEFLEIYNLPVDRIPENIKSVRIDLKDHYTVSLSNKLELIMKRTMELIEAGRPVLLVTESIFTANIYSNFFWSQNISHNVLTGSQNANEAEIIKMAGKKSTLTIATIIAGRGTDIKIDKDVQEIGGLAVIATEHFSSKRIDNQVRGRAGRQGENGTTEFFVSLEDKIFEDFYVKRIDRISNKKLEKLNLFQKEYIKHKIEQIQTKFEEDDYKNRFTSMEMDETLRVQREIIYHERDTIINQSELNHKQFVNLLKQYAKNIIDNENYDQTRFIFDFIDESYNIQEQINIDEKISDRFNYVQNLLSSYPKAFEEFVNQILLKSIDTEWVLHVDRMQQLRLLIDKRVTGQKNPLQEYQEDSQRLYKIFRSAVDKAILKNFMLSRLEVKNNLKVTFP
ncbi:hypothetical protein JC2156_16450 [Weissella koreensis KCTC 3621]|uniref:preprotein translocase subunit SecA n=1 Tax=Weissella koreensis TaxID=165096 RepID=UPI00026F44A8|nr:preprotein translocase subunit SecA [Weissella koreensis]EJF34352.1 hypothetical protein JC2156_16450 [Weissella koreensis KCTC 3621]